MRRPFSQRTLGVLLAAIALSALWYFLVGWADQSRYVTGLSGPCLDDLPAGTAHTPEGTPNLPGSRYVFFPVLGVECSYSMPDGAIFRTFQPNSAFTTMAALPIVITLLVLIRYVSSWLTWGRRERSKKPTSIRRS
jgi:ABC-type Na+ efflux pump permease subunit